jgi:hypothetical protein
MYNVGEYTDKELFQLMDLDSPTDRELEMQIHTFMNKYENMDNKIGKEMFSFYSDVYNHFFEDQEDHQEGFENDPSKKEIKKGTTTDSSYNVGVPDENTKENKQIGYTKSLDYTKGNLNPILKETIKRVISIDSQYRDITVYKNPTDFTFNLSETLHDVVSLKLYSVQIPYSWYTINNNFGSNFFYINGITSGISGENFNYKISIPSGNYQSLELATAIRNSLQTLFTNIPEVEFGTTDISYNTINSKITLTIDISNNFNESYYYLYFPYITTYKTNETVVGSIPQLLGYVNNRYTSTNINTNLFTKNTKLYYIYNTTTLTTYKNNYFTIYNYQGPSVYDSSTSVILNTILITLSISGSQSMDSIMSDINTQLQSNTMLRDSSMSIIDTSNVQLGTYKYNLNICLNRKKVKNKIGSKVVVVFPENDAYNTSTSPLWVGITSFLKFPMNTNEVGNIVSELIGKTTNYYIFSTPFVVFKCINQYYTDTTTIPVYSEHYIYTEDFVTETTTYITDITYAINDTSFNIASSSSLLRTNNYYTLTEYISAIQTGMDTLDKTAFYCTISHISPDYNISMNIDITNTIPFKTIDVSGDVLDNFSLDISNCILHTILGFSNTLTDISYNSSSTKIATYTVTAGTTNTSANNTFIIKSIGTRQFSVPDITVTIASGTYGGIGNLLGAINDAFDNVNSYNVSMSDCLITSVTNTDNIICTLNLNINATLTNDDYMIYLFDPSNNTNVKSDPYTGDDYNFWDSSNNSWYNYLNFTSQYNGITDSVVKSSTVNDNDMILDLSNCFFYIKPISYNESLYDPSGGVYTSDNSNDISFNLSVETVDASALNIGTSYTKTDIINNINLRLSSNSITNGSYIDISTNLTGYTILRLNINKTYTSKDYQLVFYDQASFSHCNFGYPSSTQNATWDTTLGWLLGYRGLQKFNLTPSYLNTDNFGNTYYTGSINSFYTYDTSSGIVSIRGDTSVNVNLYNYFMIILDDYTQNHLNDGLITVTTADLDVPLPSYASRSSYRCDPTSTENNYSVSDTTNSGQTNKLTANQLYSANQILSNKLNKQPYFSTGPFVQDIFGLIPIKTSGLVNGQSYIEFGGTLQIQERIYFGPVNLRRMSVRLMNDKGMVLDLNNANWSLSFIAEMLYNPNK